MSSPSSGKPCTPPTPSLSQRPTNRCTTSSVPPGDGRYWVIGQSAPRVSPASSIASRWATSSGCSSLSIRPATSSSSQGLASFCIAPTRNCSMSTTQSALRVVGQHADRVMADEQFPTDFPAHAAVELAMPQAQAIETIEAAEAFLALHELDVTGAGLKVSDILDSLHSGMWVSRHPIAARRRAQPLSGQLGKTSWRSPHGRVPGHG